MYWSMYSGGSPGSEEELLTKAIESWYGESKDYDYTTGKGIGGAVTGHFTQARRDAEPSIHMPHPPAAALNPAK